MKVTHLSRIMKGVAANRTSLCPMIGVGFDAPFTMPDTPMIRPRRKRYRDAARPIKTPPASDGSGVKLGEMTIAPMTVADVAADDNGESDGSEGNGARSQGDAPRKVGP